MPFSKYSSKQKKLAQVAKPRTKITAADFKKLNKKKKKKKSAKVKNMYFVLYLWRKDILSESE